MGKNNKPTPPLEKQRQFCCSDVFRIYKKQKLLRKNGNKNSPCNIRF